MSEQKKILGQADLAVNILTDVYEVPLGRSAVISTIFVCNRVAAGNSFRISVASAGAADSPEQYIYYDVQIPTNETFAGTVGITMEAGDVLRAWAAGDGLSVNIFGTEIY